MTLLKTWNGYVNRFAELLNQYCPEGVPYKSLESLGTLFGGLSGKTKSDFGTGEAHYVTYMNIFNNDSLDFSAVERVNVMPGEKQNAIHKGDILFTGSSETPGECGMSSVVMEEPKAPLYLNSFSFGFRPNDTNTLLSAYLKYVFRYSKTRKAISKSASGVTRFNISKKRFVKIKIPVPHVQIQLEIVKTLDLFDGLQDALISELSARKLQFEHYKNVLLAPDGDENIVSLSSVADYVKTRTEASNMNARNYVGVDSLLPNKQGRKDSNHVPVEGKVIEYQPDDILMGNIRPYLKKVWLSDREGGTNNDVLVIRSRDVEEMITPEYLYYVLSTDHFFEYNNQFSKGAKMPRGDKVSIMNYRFYLPTIPRQVKITALLGRFDALLNDAALGLPAEISLHQKQYNYYRDKLLSFKELSA